MALRIILFLSCLTAAGWFMHREQAAGQLQQLDDHFLGFLISSSRDKLTTPPDNPTDDQVVFVNMRREESREFAAWPPPPLDWRTVLAGLKPYEPSVVVVTTPLFWGKPAPDFVPAVADALLQFSSTVLAVEAQTTQEKTDTPPFMGDLQNAIPRFMQVEGDIHTAPALKSLITAPDPAIRPHGELGILAARSSGNHTWLVPYALREDNNLIPSILAQTLARYAQSPYAFQRIRLGRDSGVHLQKGLFIPLLPSGEIQIDPNRKVPTVNALSLMTGTLLDSTTDEDKAALGKHKVVVIGIDDPTQPDVPNFGRLYATALSQILSMPRLQIMTQIQQWITWAVIAACGLCMFFFVPRKLVWLVSLGLFFAAFVTVVWIFWTTLIWCPPGMPVVLLLVSTVAASILGVKGETNEEEKSVKQTA